MKGLWITVVLFLKFFFKKMSFTFRDFPQKPPRENSTVVP